MLRLVDDDDRQDRMLSADVGDRGDSSGDNLSPFSVAPSNDPFFELLHGVPKKRLVAVSETRRPINRSVKLGFLSPLRVEGTRKALAALNTYDRYCRAASAALPR